MINSLLLDFVAGLWNVLHNLDVNLQLVTVAAMLWLDSIILDLQL